MTKKKKQPTRELIWDYLTVPRSGDQIMEKLGLTTSAIHTAIWGMNKLGCIVKDKKDGVVYYARKEGAERPTSDPAKAKAAKKTNPTASTPRTRKPKPKDDKGLFELAVDNLLAAVADWEKDMNELAREVLEAWDKVQGKLMTDRDKAELESLQNFKKTAMAQAAELIKRTKRRR
jgi:biotin operon repressor